MSLTWFCYTVGSSGLPSLSLKSYPSPPAFEKIIRVQAGYHLGLECEVGGGGQSSAITWFRDGTEFSTDSIRQSRDTLQFDNVTKMADGVYKCCLDNEKYCSNEIEVKVTGRPNVPYCQSNIQSVYTQKLRYVGLT